MPTVIEFYIKDSIRNKFISDLSDFFDNKTSSVIEKGTYNFTKQYCECNNCDLSLSLSIYNHVTENLLFCLNSNNSTITKLISQIKKKKFNPYNLAFLPQNELDEDGWYKIMSRRATSEDKINNLPTMEWKPCRDCKNTQYSYYMLQTRSVDEPMTTFYICKKCNKTYRVNN